VYDGNLVFQERYFTPQLSTLIPQQAITYTRGRDLSGTLEGAGGIGGLLARTDNGLFAIGAPGAHAYYHADGNGNVTCLINANQVIVAHYLYDPYGNILSQRGPLADANLYRFSSKEIHVASGLLYYLYRFYDPTFQRWVNRDPIQEVGGFNLYAYVLNTPQNGIDSTGLVCWKDVITGGLTTIGGLGSIVGGATLTGATFGGAAIIGGIALFAGGTSFGLGITTLANGLGSKDCEAARKKVQTPTCTIPQGPVELLGAMTGNQAAQEWGSAIDIPISMRLPPWWGGYLSLGNYLMGASWPD
jgi:RHS repeat-associated protein